MLKYLTTCRDQIKSSKVCFGQQSQCTADLSCTDQCLLVVDVDVVFTLVCGYKAGILTAKQLLEQE